MTRERGRDEGVSKGRVFEALAILLTVVTITLIIGGVWWWALLGMSVEVGSAVMVTAFVTCCGAAATWGLGSEVDR